jgi:hypothetical protein
MVGTAAHVMEQIRDHAPSAADIYSLRSRCAAATGITVGGVARR